MASARLAIAAVVPRLAPPSSRSAATVRRRPEVRRPGRRRLRGYIAHRGGQPVLEVGIEAVLGLARLQIEEAEDQ